MVVYLYREELGKSINTDEAAALGAVYQAAHLSKGFKVKKFAVKEANLYPIQVYIYLMKCLCVYIRYININIQYLPE